MPLFSPVIIRLLVYVYPVGCPVLLMQKILHQDADIIPLADKGIVVIQFVRRTMTNFSDNLRVKENGFVSGVDRVFKSSNSTFQNIGDRHNPLGKSVDFVILPLCPPSSILLTRIHDDILKKFWCHENETGSLYLGPLGKRSLCFWLQTM